MTQVAGDYEGLDGVRVLVVEDELALLMDLEITLAEAGAVVVGLCRTLDEALACSDIADFAVAVLDYQLGDETVLPLARRLLGRGVPFVLHTGRAHSDLSMAECWRCPIVEKPAIPRVLISAVRSVLPK
jgi:DNA-binding response OmpR family regulator